MTTNLAKWASNNGQIIKSGLPNDRRAKFLPSVVGFAYDLLRYEYYLGNIGLNSPYLGLDVERFFVGLRTPRKL